MAKSLRILGALALVALGFWGWRTLFPSPEKVIRSRLKALAKAASFDSREGTIVRAFKAESVAEYFTLDAQIAVTSSGFPDVNLNGRNEISQAGLAARSRFTGLKAEFLDINVTLGPDKQTATAELTGKATIAGESDIYVQELRFKLKLVDGKWLISHVESVKSLSQRRTAPAPVRNESELLSTTG